MMFRHRRMQFFCVLSALLTVIALVVIQIANPPTAHAATNQFRGVNWANPNDNFITGNLVPVGLSTADNYATTYAKATAILKVFQSLGANTVRLPFNAATTSGAWWGSYTAAWDAASALGMKVVVAPWLQNGKVSDTTSFYQMWDTVINKYGGNSNFYFDIALPQITSAFSTISPPLDATPGSPLRPVYIGLFSPGETTVSGAR